MRTVALAMLFSAAVVLAQENRLPQEEAVRYAKLCVAQADLRDAPIATRPMPEKACAERGEGGGAMVIPDKNLALDLAKSDDVIPIGQLWLRKWTLATTERAVPRGKMRLLTLNIDDKARPMPVCLLGVRKTAGDMQLLVYGAGSKPLQTIPLKRVEYEQELPIILEWQRGEQSIDTLMIRILGRLETKLFVTRQAD